MSRAPTNQSNGIEDDHPTNAISTHHFDSPFLPTKVETDNNKAPGTQKKTKTALIILNSPISSPPSLVFQKLWKLSDIRICADGGANRLYDATKDTTKVTSNEQNATDSANYSYIPDLIRGDLDSLRQEVRSFYEKQGCKVEQEIDQDYNDLDKSLSSVKDFFMRNPSCNKSHGVSTKRSVDKQDLDICIFVYGAFGGRFDQEMASLQALYKWGDEFDHRMTLYNDETCAFLLPPNKRNEIRLPFIAKKLDDTTEIRASDDEIDEIPDQNASQTKVGEGPTCGLIPLGRRCDTVRTSGLQWDLDGSLPLEFGGLVSTSNRVISDVVTVEASHELVFTVEMTLMKTHHTVQK